MTKPIIVCDIDDVVFPFIPGMADHYNQLRGASLTAEDFVSFNLTEVWGGTMEETNEIVHTFLSEQRLHLQPLDGAVEAFTRLKEDFDIVMVTARNGMFEENTTAWLRVHFADLFSHAIFAGNPHDGNPYRTKGEICKELQAALIIDDFPGNILSARDHGTDGIFFGTKQWTLDGARDYPDVAHCRDWQETLEYIYEKWPYKRLS